MFNIFSTKGFLQVGGVVLLLIGVLGYLGLLIGPTPEQSLFGSAWYFDGAENFAHTLLGVVAIAAAYLLKDAMMRKYLVVTVGVLALIAALASLVGPVTMGSNLLGAQLQNPADTVLHLVVGAWAFYAAFMGAKEVKS